MHIGLTCIYNWRPHAEHLQYLAGLARQAGHTLSFLTCDADLERCYTRALRPGRSALVHCAGCRLSGVRTFGGGRIHSLGLADNGAWPRPEEAAGWARSSASTLGRFESDEDFAGPEFQALADGLAATAARGHAAARRWIERERLDAVILFNGRMDVTRGVLEAARAAAVPFVSLERTWFGHGLLLLPGESCLGLRTVGRLVAEWRDRPLTARQARLAAGHVASRFLRRNAGEWRAYNTSAQARPWPVAGGRRRLLLVPGSRNEVWGHPDWRSAWPDRTGAYDALLAHLGLGPGDAVLRCHPNWGERIGEADGARIERHYAGWARRRGVHCIASTDPTSTLGLIEQSDAVVVMGGSAALEAGALGKQVIALGPSVYQRAGFQTDADGPAALAQVSLDADLDPAEQARRAARVARLTLRFGYAMTHRVPQYVEQVRCLTPTRYAFAEGGDPGRLTALLASGVLQADDGEAAAGPEAEDEVLAALARRDWAALLPRPEDAPAAPLRPLRRRWPFRPMDWLRDGLPRRDR